MTRGEVDAYEIARQWHWEEGVEREETNKATSSSRIGEGETKS